MTETVDREITTHDLQRFFAGKKIFGCSVCGQHAWRVENEASPLPGGLNLPAVNPCDRRDVIAVVCENCGVIELHARQVVARWLDCHRKA